MRVGGCVAIGLAAGLVGPAVLEAHGIGREAWNEPGALSAWDVGALLLLGASGVLYARGVLMRGRQPLREIAAFSTGWLALVISILPPLDDLAIQLFSAHMLQHELMMLVGAPLVMAGRPLATCLWGLSPNLRLRAGRALRRRAVSAVWQIGTAPLAAWLVHGLAVWVWHLPALYDAAVGNEAVHAVQHATFVSTSALFWWGLLYGRYGRAGYGAAVFYVFTTVIHTGLLGAVLTFSGVALYPAYMAAAAARGIDPLADQQVAGLVMWIPAGAVLSLLGVGLFVAWLGEAERRLRQQDAMRAPAPLAREVGP